MIMIVQLLSIATVFATGDTSGTPHDASSGSSLSVLPGSDNKIPSIPMSATALRDDWGPVTIRERGYANCIDSPKHENGENAHVVACEENNWNQMWTYTASGQLKLYKTEWCLDAGGPQTEYVHLWECGNDNWNQMWSYDASSGAIALKGTNRCLQIFDPNTSWLNSIVLVPCGWQQNSRRWWTLADAPHWRRRVEQTASSTLSAVTSGSFMTIHDKDTRTWPSCIECTEHKNGGGIHMYDCDSSNWNQRWTWTSSGQIKLLETEWCLDGQPEEYGTVHLWTCGDNNWNQMWAYYEGRLCMRGTGYCLTNILNGLTVLTVAMGVTDWDLWYGNDYTNLPTLETQSAVKLSSVKMSARTLSGSGGYDGTPTPSAEPMLAPESAVSPMDRMFTDRMFTELARVRIGDKVCFERLVAKLSRTSCSALASVLPEVPCARDYVQPEFEMIAEYVCRYMGDVDISKTMHDRSVPDLS